MTVDPVTEHNESRSPALGSRNGDKGLGTSGPSSGFHEMK